MMRPGALVIDEDIGARCVAAQAFAAAGWGAVGAGRDGWQAAGRADPPALILFGIDADRAEAARLLSAVRAAKATGDAPIVAWSAAPPERLIAQGFDDVLPRGCPAATVAALAKRWQPDEPCETLARLEGSLGAAAVAPIVEGLRCQLAAALSEPAGHGDADMAHRIAGIAGMLGFADLGARWLALSHGEAGAWAAARAATRRALLALARRRPPAAASAGG